MPAMFDLHVAVSLYDSWQILAKSEDSFVEMIPRMPETVLREWHRVLTDDGQKPEQVSIGTSFNLRRHPPPCWIVQLEEETDLAQTMGFVNGDEDDDGHPYRWMAETQIATITTIAHSKELVRAMHVIGKGIMMQNNDWFREAGYGGIMYAGGGDLTPDESLASELQGMFLRTQRWRCTAELCVRPVARTQRKPYLVAAEAVIVDGIRGGAVPVENGG